MTAGEPQSDDHTAPAGSIGPVRTVAIIGDASLAGHCIDLAIAGGLEVAVVATEHHQVRDRATELGIAWVPSNGDLVGALEPYAFEGLLSIANLRVLPTSLLERATVAANFHDGPLPGYSGLNVTTWALLNGETEHAVTWHLMTADVDRGEVLATERFPIQADDTTFSLNARCYEAAIASFPAIVDGLTNGTLSPTPQPAGERHLFRRFDRPTSIVDARRPAAAIARTARALSFGHQTASTMGSMHLLAGERHVVITGAREVAGQGASAGTISLDADGVRLATVDGDVIFTALERPDGRVLTPVEALDALDLSDGDTLPTPSDSLVAAHADADRELARQEPFWRERLADVEPVAPSVLGTEVGIDPRSVDRALPAGVTPADVAASVAAWCWRLTGASSTAIAITDRATRRSLHELTPLAMPPVARFAVDESTSFGQLCGQAADEIRTVSEHGVVLADLVGRDPSMRGTERHPRIVVELDSDATAPTATPRDALTIAIGAEAGTIRVTGPLDEPTLGRIAGQIEALLVGGLAAPSTSITHLPVMSSDDAAAIDELNRTDLDHDRATTIDRMIAAQAELTPDAPAVSSDGSTLTYRELMTAVDGFAARLRQAGVGRADRVGIALERGADMLVAMIATHACGAAYVPLDPAYPADRIRLMITDSGLRTIVAEPATAASLPVEGLTVIHPGPDEASAATEPQQAEHDATDLAYVIYTSGSTGTPKGVMLEHRNVVNFFAAMDEVIDHDDPGVWLAVTSLSFDISVLELLWTLTRGFHVVIKAESGARSVARARTSGPRRPLSMSLFYFAAGEDAAHDGYRLLLDSARWADQHGFEAVWTPERHFHAFGGAYPNPSVVGAAIAAVTERVQIRAGSVVAPLHSPARIAEEWAVVDNLSGGRVGISFAAGWQPNDFVLNPGAYADAREQLPSMIDTIQRLWRGESVDMPGHDGVAIPVTTLPRPRQAELPVWLTSAGTPATFERAGTLGVNLLTHLLGQSVEQLTENIARYRAAWDAAGHEGSGRVTLMLHTYLNDDAETSRRIAHDPMKGYLGTAAGLLRNMASAFPTFAGSGKSADEAFASLTEDELDQLLEMAATRYLDGSGLFGTADDAVDMIEQCSDAGVDEVACLIDFGIDTELVLDSLPLVGRVHDRLEQARDTHAAVDAGTAPAPAADASFAELVSHYGATHLQCTPSLATMLVADPTDRAALSTIGHVMLGGEVLPVALADELHALLPGRLTNMYGPTETTIWSLVHEVDGPPDGPVPIGRPIGNNTVFVLDPRGTQVPIGVFGELHIGGEGVARGYHDRDELTRERFVQREGMGRLYATGDIVRVRADGIVEFAGRIDHQVKIRGHRIELGEIETILDGHPDIVHSVVLAHESGHGEPTLAAYVITRDGRDLDDTSARTLIGGSLPDAYVPGRFVQLDAFPLTPNGKTDRGRLLADAGSFQSVAPTATTPLDDDLERLVAEIWMAELQRPVGRDDNFFEIGGNSLLAVSVFRRIGDSTPAQLALTDVFRYPTVRSFAAHLGTRNGAAGDAGKVATTEATSGTDRGAMRRRAMARRSS